MTEYVLSINLSLCFSIAFLSLVIQVALVKKTLFTWYDPLLQYLFFNSFSIALVVYMYLAQDIQLVYLVTFLISNFTFLAGILVGHTKLSYKKVSLSLGLSRTSKFSVFNHYSQHLNVFLIISCTILILTNLFLILTFGTLPIFSENADIAKVSSRVGLGIVFRINDALLPASLSIVLIKLFNPVYTAKLNEKIYLILVFIFLVFLAISGGSKGSILIVVSILFSIYMINRFTTRKHTSNIDKYVSCAILASLILITFVMWRLSVTTQYVSPIEGIMVRLIGTGDSLFWFYKYDLKDSFDRTPLDFLSNSFNLILSLLKLKEYDETALGEQIITQATGLMTNGFGGNSMHYLEGLIYFGNSFFWLYSFTVGYAVSFTRTYFLKIVLKHPNQSNLFIYTILSYYIMRFPIDSSHFLGGIYSTVIIGGPIFLVSYLFNFSKRYQLKKSN